MSNNTDTLEAAQDNTCDARASCLCRAPWGCCAHGWWFRHRLEWIVQFRWWDPFYTDMWIRDLCHRMRTEVRCG